jgi:ribonucleotide monophosphatase NagD (HAD superfamily)
MMVGDRLETDILMGQQAGMVTAAVLTGASTQQAAEAMSPPPDYILDSIAQIPDALATCK